MADLGTAFLGSAGFTGAYNSGNAADVLQTLNNRNQEATVAWNNYAGNLAGNSNTFANTNYNAQAQEEFKRQQANYAQQQSAAGMLYNQATGAAPSMADLQMQNGLGLANNQVQSSMLSQQGGVMPGLSQRNMLNAQAQQNAQMVASGQANRAQELNQAQQNYSGLLGQMGQTAAGMTNQQNLYGQQARQQQLDNLAYQTTYNNTLQAQNASNAMTAYTGAMANLQAEAASNKDQFNAFGNSLGAFMNGATAIQANQANKSAGG